MSFHQKILNILLPQTCRVCSRLLKNADKICPDCFSRIRWIEGPHCSICGSPFESSAAVPHPCPNCLDAKPPFDVHRSCVVYGDEIRQLISRLKYRAGFDLNNLFSAWMLERNADVLKGADYLVPVPLSISRLRRRTYNQSLELTKALSRKTGIPVLIHSLKKIKETRPQTKLPRDERLKNLHGAFAWSDPKTNLEEKNAILIDDVFTTGSTLSACAAALRRQKPLTIGALTIALNLPKF